MWQVIGANWWWLGLQAILVATSGLTAGTETAIFSLTAEDRVQLDRKAGMFARAAVKLYHDRDRLIVSLLTINMFVNLGYFAIMQRLAPLLAQAAQSDGWMGSRAAWWLVQLLGLQGILVFGEVVPKLFASRRNRAFAESTAVPYLMAHRAFCVTGMNRVLNLLTRRLESFVSIESAGGEEGLSVDDLREAVNRTAGLGAEDKQRLRALFSLSFLKVSAILMPRVDVLFARAGMTIDQALDVAVLHGLRVLPVKGESSDDIRGAVYIHDLLAHANRGEPVEAVLRPCIFLPEVASVESFILALRAAGENFAIIVDEFGGTSGVASLEDAIELVLGEFEDEYAGAALGWQETQGRIRLDGGCPLHKFRERLEGRPALSEVDWAQIDLPDVETVGGFVQQRTGKSPEVGQAIVWQRMVFRVLRVSNNRIRLLEVRLPGSSLSGRYKSQALALPLPGGRL
ncbi:MAG: hemolysin family protein [Planctomycetota bacterium]